MKFRPCIDIHNGKVKQIVGNTLRDRGADARDNFVSVKDADFYSSLYKRDGLAGGHVIMLNPHESEFYRKDLHQAFLALNKYPGGMQAGGGINDTNARDFLDAGASHVIVTSFVFSDGMINFENLKKLVNAAGKEHIVLDLSCRKCDGEYHIVTDRWQKVSREILNYDTISRLSSCCDEFLIHAVDSEGKQQGIERGVLNLIADAVEKDESLIFTYAGGIKSEEDIELIEKEGNGRVDFTVGSALDLFGGHLKYTDLAARWK